MSAGRTKEELLPPPGVSVVIVNWNTRDMVLRLLASLSTPNEGSAHEVELIVVDNNSSDGSVEAIGREFPTVKLVAQAENRGFAGGVNPGTRVATKPFVLLLNSDAETSRASIEEAARYMAASPEVGILGPQILSPERRPQSSAWRDPSLTWMALSAVGLSKLKPLNFERYHEKPFTEPAEVDCVSGCAMMIRRDLLEELGGFDEDYFMYFEETDFCVRARRHGKQVHHAPIGEFLHDEGGTSRKVRLRTFLDFRRSQILFQKKHGGVAAAMAARGLLALSSALRVPPLAVLSLTGSSDWARTQLRLHCSGLAWLMNPSSGLIPDVDRSD
ncbi:MAG: glycosyltransferase family 2 protein [Polyangiales bacterium]